MDVKSKVFRLNWDIHSSFEHLIGELIQGLRLIIFFRFINKSSFKLGCLFVHPNSEFQNTLQLLQLYMECRELTRIPNLWETKKIEKTHAKENNHTHKTIFTWFGNLPSSTELQGFHNYQGRIQSAATVFSLSKTRQQHHHKTLITKVGSIRV